jgi:Tol biopolymer transport system component
VFVSGGDLWTAALEGGEARLLVSHPATESRPIYSPDGARLAFVSNRTGNGDIYVLTLVTGELARITHGDTVDQLDAWSHDGAWLYFSSNQHEVSGLSNVFRVGSTADHQGRREVCVADVDRQRHPTDLHERSRRRREPVDAVPRRRSTPAHEVHQRTGVMAVDRV